MKNIKIAVLDSPDGNRQAAFAQAGLASQGIASELVVLGGLSAQEGERAIQEALLRGDADMAVQALADLPTQAAEGLVVAGVSPRSNPSEWLLVRQGARAEGELFKLKKQAVVGAFSRCSMAQLLSFRNDLQLVEVPGELADPTQAFRQGAGAWDALVQPAASLAEADLAGLEVVRFNPRELVPTPGQGVLAYRCCETDLATRRLIGQIHHRDVSAATNVERRISQLLSQAGPGDLSVGAYCERDAGGYFHVWAAMAGNGTLRRAQLSQSTSHLMAEKVVEKLTKVG